MTGIRPQKVELINYGKNNNNEKWQIHPLLVMNGNTKWNHIPALWQDMY